METHPGTILWNCSIRSYSPTPNGIVFNSCPQQNFQTGTPPLSLQHPPRTACVPFLLSAPDAPLLNHFAHPCHFQFPFLPFFSFYPFFLSLHSALWVDPLSWGGKKDITYEMSRVGCSLLCLTCRVRNFVNKCIKAKLCALC